MSRDLGTQRKRSCYFLVFSLLCSLAFGGEQEAEPVNSEWQKDVDSRVAALARSLYKQEVRIEALTLRLRQLDRANRQHEQEQEHQQEQVQQVQKQALDVFIEKHKVKKK